ncbi:hypothetical protein AK812_SmicGene27079 [Symbiodinium microadriaticum]|uniref:Uncharacterized protein n=1 Tax=Symbiodinium microadriaticum TaxID=2951 RepID=A0A1Q9D7U4_SYMMI|nr:hypothetical protein AK812_SmicGene27079 [Symbiodinium microadriaticum]
MYDEDDVPVIRDGILERLQAEAETLAKRLSRRAHPVEGRHACPACPFRSFRVRERRQLRVHFAKYHSAKNQFVCSGTKQLKVILALSDHAASSQTSACDLLETSATIMRSTVVPPLGATLHHIDKRIRLVYKAAGPVYVNADSIGTTLHVRRARNTYYAQDFTDLLLREAVLCHAQVADVLDNMDTEVVYLETLDDSEDEGRHAPGYGVVSAPGNQAKLLTYSAIFREQI